MIDRRRAGIVLAMLVSCAAAFASNSAASEVIEGPVLHGAVVETVRDASAAHQAGIRPDDVLLRWHRAAAAPAYPSAANGLIDSPLDLLDVELEQGPRGALTLEGTRAGQPLSIALPPGKWHLGARPSFASSELTSYEHGRELIDAGNLEDGREVWWRLASTFAERGDMVTAAWLWLRVAAVAAPPGSEADRAYDAAQRVAAVGNPLLQASILEAQAGALHRRSELERAVGSYRRAIEIRRSGGDPNLRLAKSLNSLGLVAIDRGDLTAAQDAFRRSMVIRERLAPRSLQVATVLNNLGLVAFSRGDLVLAEDFFRRALEIHNVLAPSSMEDAMSFSNLGAVAVQRGDLAAAEDYFRRTLTISEKIEPEGVGTSISLSNLGFVALQRGNLAVAENAYRRALAIDEAQLPGSVEVATSLVNLASTVFERGDLATAEREIHRALAIYERVAPRGVDRAEAVRVLGDIALARSAMDAAEGHFRHALAIARERAPGSALESTVCERLASLHRQRGNLDEAVTFARCAVNALETQRSRLGGSDETRSGFGARHAGVYHQAIDLLVETGHSEEAFHLLERYRARELLTLMAARNLVFSADIPARLEEARRTANQRYEEALERSISLPEESSAEERRQTRTALERARLDQDAVRAEIRSAAPRLADLRDPRPLDLDATRAALDPGTLLLSFSVGELRSQVFAIGPDPGSFVVETLDVGEDSLRQEVEHFRRVLARGAIDPRRERSVLLARGLSQHLLAPVAESIAGAERLLILADGPLHSLPFAALVDPATPEGERYLVESMPIHRAASATVFALAKNERRVGRAVQLVAFGDPRYPDAVADAEPALRAASGKGLALRPLPASRREVEGLAALFPGAARFYVGAEATEDRAKGVDRATTHLHIAAHGLLDDRFPLESALAFTIPQHRLDGQDNGLLQAWEIFEQVRIDADLVTLSACDSGRGKVLGGEGLLGLTRAFHYAGARSVLASLWSIGDVSTGELMKRFYGYLQAGKSKAEALRDAQLDLLHRSRYTHPFHWAAFELVGDWR